MQTGPTLRGPHEWSHDLAQHSCEPALHRHVSKAAALIMSLQDGHGFTGASRLRGAPVSRRG
jgi:hypothetical protein